MAAARRNGLSRRDFLHAGTAAAAALCLRGETRAADAPDPNRGFKVGIQSYSLRTYKVERALELSQKLGLKYWESYRDHMPVNAVPAKIAEQKKLLEGAGVQLIAFGVVSFTPDESKAREVFDYAQAMGIRSLSANPQKDEATFKMLDKLVEEYKINIAIHNHGPKDRYDKIDDVWNAIKDHHPRIGACVDTGHYLRSGESPVAAIDRFGDRVYGVHLKDVKDNKVFRILGEGDLDVLGCLKSLKSRKYDYCLALEYEESEQNPIPDIEICLTNLRKSLQQLG